MVFDVLARVEKDTRRLPLRERRKLLEELAAKWVPPLQLSPATSDETVARGWMTDYRPAGVEGLVVKAADSAYTPGRRTWIKVKSRETAEVIIGGITGTLERPDTIVAGLVRDGELHVVGRSTPLTHDQASALSGALTPAQPDHPWPDVISVQPVWRVPDKVPLVKVEPLIVAEVLADTALLAGGYRHPVRLIRPRFDLAPEELAHGQS